MAKTRLNKPTPKTQREISVEQHKSDYVPAGNPNYDDPNVKPVSRALQTSFKGDNVKPFSIGIQDIDEAVFYYFENVIQPSVLQNGERLPVPVIYGSPEKWKSYQKDGYYRDQFGKIQAPLIMFKRTNIDKNRQIANKLDANNPNNFGVFTKRYSPQNAYDNFNVLNNRQPVKEMMVVAHPDYVTITYELNVYADFVEQSNRILEAIQYAENSYWGDKNRYYFRVNIDSFPTTVQYAAEEERTVVSKITMKLHGYLIPDTINAYLSHDMSYVSKGQVIFNEYAVDDLIVPVSIKKPKITNVNPISPPIRRAAKMLRSVQPFGNEEPKSLLNIGITALAAARIVIKPRTSVMRTRVFTANREPARTPMVEPAIIAAILIRVPKPIIMISTSLTYSIP